MTDPMILSHVAANALLAARRGHAITLDVSTDLNRSTTAIALSEVGVTLRDVTLTWQQIEAIAGDDAGCYLCTSAGLEKIQIFSEETQRVYTLYPTTGAPTMLISGIPMHRIKGTDPQQDTLSKVRALGRSAGRVLDTCTGLGYTALALATRASAVITVELDSAVHVIIRQNPWSCALFTTPNITPLVGDIGEVIRTFDDASFDSILHDPPMFSLAGELYSLDFYRELHRVLRRSGRLFHYIGNPESRSGATTTRGVLKRLGDAGFRRIESRAQAFGVAAIK